MQVIIEQTETIKFFKWVILTKTIIKNHKIVSSEPLFVPNQEYYNKEFLN